MCNRVQSIMVKVFKGHLWVTYFILTAYRYVCFALFGDLWLSLCMFHFSGVGIVIMSVFLKSSIKTPKTA